MCHLAETRKLNKNQLCEWRNQDRSYVEAEEK